MPGRAPGRVLCDRGDTAKCTEARRAQEKEIEASRKQRAGREVLAAADTSTAALAQAHREPLAHRGPVHARGVSPRGRGELASALSQRSGLHSCAQHSTRVFCASCCQVWGFR